MRTKTVFILLAGMLFYGLQQSEAQYNSNHPIPYSTDEKEQLLQVLSIIEIADIKGLDALNIDEKITDTILAVDLLKQAYAKKAYLMSELHAFNQAAAEARIQNLIYTTNSIAVLDTGGSYSSESATSANRLLDPGWFNKKILSERVEQKILLLQHQQYIEKEAVRRASLFEFFTSLNKTFTFQALEDIKITVSMDDPECSQIMVKSLEEKRRYFESQLAREIRITALRISLNEHF